MIPAAQPSGPMDGEALDLKNANYQLDRCQFHCRRRISGSHENLICTTIRLC
jgi:hypothetical protein